MTDGEGRGEDDAREERWLALAELDDWLRTPMLVLSFAWLALVVAELALGESRAFELFGTAIWIVFLLEFALRLALAPEKLGFLRSNWLTAIALLAPALRLVRVFRVLRAARALRGFRLVRIVGTANRGMNALRAALRRRRLGYVVGLTVAVALLGAGGMLAFEPADEVEGGFTGYADALWWTGMLLTTMGSEFWPRTLEGRILTFSCRYTASRCSATSPPRSRPSSSGATPFRNRTTSDRDRSREDQLQTRTAPF